jgi:hypothetical protein
LLLALGLGFGALGLALLGWPVATPPPVAAPFEQAAPLPPELADQVLPALVERLQACAETSSAPACRGLAVLAFKLRAADAEASVVELQVREGTLGDDLMACLRRAAGDIRRPTAQPRGELSVEVPVTCGLDGRPRMLPLRGGRSFSAEDPRPAPRP